MENEITAPAISTLPNQNRRRRKLLFATAAFLILLPVAMLVISACQSHVSIRHNNEAIVSSLEWQAELNLQTAKWKKNRKRPSLLTTYDLTGEKYLAAMLDQNYLDATRYATERIERHHLSSDYCDRGDAYFMRGDYESALNDYHDALRRFTPIEFFDLHRPPSDYFDDRMPPGYYFQRRGDTYFKLGRYREAFKDYRQMISMERHMDLSSLGAVYAALAQIFASSSQFEFAAKLEKTASEFFAPNK